MKYIGKRVKTKYGEGTVIDIDLPKSGFNHSSRLVVKLDNDGAWPNPSAFFLNQIEL